MADERMQEHRGGGGRGAGRKAGRGLRIALFGLLSFLMLAIVLVGAGALFLNTNAGRAWLESTVENALADAGMEADIQGLAGNPFDRLTADGLRLSDPRGPWLEASELILDWSPWSLLGGTLAVETIGAGSIHVMRPPELSPTDTPDEDRRPVAANPLEVLPVGVRVGDLSVHRLRLDEPVAGAAATLQVSAAATATRSEAQLQLTVDRVDDRPGNLAVEAAWEPARDRFVLEVAGREPAGGLIAELLGLEGAPAVDAVVTGTGSLSDWSGEARLVAGGETLFEADLAMQGVEPIRFAVSGWADAPRLLDEQTGEILGGPVDFIFEGEVADRERVRLDASSVVAPAARIVASGMVDLARETLDVRASLAALDPDVVARIVPDARIDDPVVEVRAEGNLSAPVIRADIATSRLALPDAGADADAVEVAVRSEGPLNAPTISAEVSVGRIQVPEVAASGVRLTIRSDGPIAAPSASVELTAAEVTAAGTDIPGLRAVLTAVPEGEALERVAFDFGFEAPIVRMADGTVYEDARIETSGLAQLDPVVVAVERMTASLPGVLAEFAGTIEPSPIAARGNLTLAVAEDAPLPGLDAVPLDGGLNVEARLVYGEAGLVLEDLEAATGFASMAGRATLDAGFERLDAELRRFDVALAPLSDVAGVPLAGRLSAQGRVQGPLNAPEGRLHATATELSVDGTALGRAEATLNARVREAGPAGRLDLALSPPDLPRIEAGAGFALVERTFRVDGLMVTGGGARLTGDVRVDLETTLARGTLELAVPDASELGALVGEPLQGSLAGTIGLSVEGGAQAIAADFRGEDLEVPAGEERRLRVGTLSLDGRTRLVEGTPLTLAVTASDVVTDEVELDRVALDMDGALAGGMVDLAASGSLVRAEGARPLPVDLTLSGRLRREGEATIFALDGGGGHLGDERFRLGQDLVVRVGPDDYAVRDFLFETRFGSIGASASLVDEAIEARIDVDDADLAGVALLVPGIEADGRLDVELVADGTLVRPTATLRLRLREVTAPEIDAPPLDLVVAADLGDERLQAEAVASGFGTTPLQLNASVERMPTGLGFEDASALTLGLRWRGEIGALMALAPMPEHRLTGHAEVTLGVGGSLGDPVVSGEAVFTDARYEHLEHGTLLRFDRLVVDGRGRELTLQPFTARDGSGGTLSGRGRVEIDPDQSFPLFLDLEFARASLVDRDEIEATLSGTVRIEGALDDMAVVARLVTDEVEINIAATLPPGVTDLRVTEAGIRPDHGAAAAREEDTQPRDGPVNVSLDVEVRMPQRVFVRGRGLDSEWSGNIRVTGTAARPQVDGVLRSMRGRLDLAGRNFVIAPSTIRLATAADGGVDVVLDVRTSVDADDATVFVNVVGTAGQPEIEMSATPQLPEDEIMSRLLFGKTAGALSAIEAVQLARSVATVTGRGGGLDPIGTIRETLGVDVLRVDATDEDGPAVEAGTYLLDDLYVGVRQGATTGSGSVTVELDVLDFLTVESEIRQDGTTKTGVKMKWDY